MYIHIFSLKKSQTAFLLHLKALHMLKAEQGLHWLFMILLQKGNYAEYRVSLHTELHPKLDKYFSVLCWILRRLSGHLPNFYHNKIILFVFSLKERILVSKRLKC